MPDNPRNTFHSEGVSLEAVSIDCDHYVVVRRLELK